MQLIWYIFYIFNPNLYVVLVEIKPSRMNSTEGDSRSPLFLYLRKPRALCNMAALWTAPSHWADITWQNQNQWSALMYAWQCDTAAGDGGIRCSLQVSVLEYEDGKVRVSDTHWFIQLTVAARWTWVSVHQKPPEAEPLGSTSSNRKRQDNPGLRGARS